MSSIISMNPASRRWLAVLAPALLASQAAAQPAAPMPAAAMPAAPMPAAPMPAAPMPAAPGSTSESAPAGPGAWQRPGGVAAAPAVEAGDADAASARRWSLAFGIGALRLSHDHGADPASFAIGELALRYRATRQLELELGVGGGRQRVDGEDGEQELVRVALALRYRLSPERPFSWYVLGGLGGAAITQRGATDREREDALQPLGMVGLGVERRFGALAVHADARALALGEHEMRKGDAMSTLARREGGALTLGMSCEF